MPIRQLPAHLVNQIAAGEVIERPASVVKELVENSVDAGASHINVEVEDGGATSITIRDDGAGIPEPELPLALAAHATSKLQTAEDLACIRTLGFRGEALASIASVSRLRLSSRATVDGNTAPAGCVIEQAGDQVGKPGPIGMPPGTVIAVRDLFFNTPARRKFLRSPGTEIGHISDTITRAAITLPHVGFTLSHNGRRSLDLPAAQDRRERCIDLLGRDLADGLLEAEHVDTPMHDHAIPSGVWALLGHPALARATGKFLYLCVNGRPVKDRNLQHAVKEAYRGLIPPDRQPVVVVHLTLDPHLVDVNVHPTKAEVRFREPQRVHGLVLSTLRRTLLGNDLTPSAQISTTFGSTAPPFPFTHADSEHASGGGGEASDSTGNNTPVARNFVDYFRRMDRRQKGFVYEEVRREMADLSDTIDALPVTPPPSPLPTPTPILHVHDSYVVTQDADGLIIVDQHALHERVMFEELRHRILDTGQPLESQRLLMPVTLPADARRQALLDDLQPLLQRVGIEAQAMGPRTIAVHAFPSLLFDRNVEPAEFMNELLNAADNGDLPPEGANGGEAALHEVLDMMSCKAAVKAGDKLTPEELSALLQKRDQIERSSNCPHGRPTTLRLSMKDLARQFGRT